MKKFLFSFIFLLILLLPINVFAAGSISVSTGVLNVQQGSTVSFSISAYNTIGDVYISSSNSNIAKVSTSFWETGMVNDHQTKSGTISVTGINVGTTNIVLKIDAATFDGEDLSGQTKTIKVNVVAKPSVTPSKPSQSTNTKPNNNVNHNPGKVLSNNNNIKSISVDGYKLTKVDNNNYTLTVQNDVSKININAQSEDGKAKITGVGSYELKIGENNIIIIVTSESGIQNRINVKINRKEGFYLEDLDYALKKNTNNNLIIKEDTKIEKDMLLKIKNSKKSVSLNYYDENKKIKYSWIIDGKKIQEANEFSTLITIDDKPVKEIYKLSNYAYGLYVNFKHNGELSKGTKIKLYVGDHFENDNLVNIYYYNESDIRLELIKNDIKVLDGYIEFDIEHCSNYFVTMSNINFLQKKENGKFDISWILIAIIVMLLIVIFRKNKKSKVKYDDEKIEIIEIDNI